MELLIENSQNIIRDYLINRCKETVRKISIYCDRNFNYELNLPILPNLEIFACVGSKIKPKNLVLLLQTSPNMKFLYIEFYLQEESYEYLLEYLESKKESYNLTHLTIYKSSKLTKRERKRYRNLKLKKLIF
jgi:hypothetical protein